ncbi:MAG: hypothetical protein QOC98_753 [Frankiaceae bacterium]|jgi:hypothetical protein|nr:hypothetical protein [Frankiaceae bacterium]
MLCILATSVAGPPAMLCPGRNAPISAHGPPERNLFVKLSA